MINNDFFYLENIVEEKCLQQKLHVRYLFTASKFVQPAEVM